MKQSLIVFLMIFVLSSSSTAKKSKIKVQLRQTSVGINLISGDSIRGMEYLFPDCVNHSFCDDSLNTVSVQLRKKMANGYLSSKGKYLVYNFKGDSVVWTRKINYNSHSVAENWEILLLKSMVGVVALNKSDGTERWNFEGNLKYLDWSRNLGIFTFSSRQSASERSKYLGCVDLTCGKCASFLSQDPDLEWNEVLPVSDDEVLLSSNGLHWINFENGSSWDYTAQTKKESFSRAIATGILGIGLGLTTGYYLIPSTDMVSDLNSNVCFQDSDLYYASRAEIIRIDRAGNLKWRQPLVKSESSQSALFAEDSIVCLLNIGTAYMNGVRVLRGRPFLRGHDVRDGKMLYEKSFQNNESVRGWKLKDAKLYIGGKDRVALYDLSGVPEETFLSLNTDAMGEFRSFLGNVAYIQKDSIYQSVTEVDSLNLYVLTSKDIVLRTDASLNLLDTFEEKELYLLTAQQDGFRFLEKDGKTIVIDENGKALAKLDMNDPVSISGNQLNWIHDKSFVRMDLTPFWNQ
jgi:hypothetical protein